MAPIRRAMILAALLGAAPALAQSPVPDPAAGAGRRVGQTGTGQTKPPAAGTLPTAGMTAPLPKPMSAADLAKAQKAAEARAKAWDVRTKRSMSSICNGC